MIRCSVPLRLHAGSDVKLSNYTITEKIIAKNRPFKCGVDLRDNFVLFARAEVLFIMTRDEMGIYGGTTAICTGSRMRLHAV